MLEFLSDPAIWLSFATLALLEVILGIDNVIFIAIVASRLPPEQQKKARFWGLIGALIMRCILLLSISWMMGLTKPLWNIGEFALSWRDLILLGGGIFLIYKASDEIIGDINGVNSEKNFKAKASLWGTMGQIMVIDMVFSLDSIITAVGIADHVEVMIAAVIFAIIVMMLASGPIAGFIQRNPTAKMLALAFLVMIGLVLTAEGLHIHVDKAFIYVAMAFCCVVEGLNILKRFKQGKN